MKRVRRNNTPDGSLNAVGLKPVKTVNQLKKKYEEVPLAFLYGIQTELEYQCPSIDEYIEKIEECKKKIKTLESKIMKENQINRKIEYSVKIKNVESLMFNLESQLSNGDIDGEN